MDHDSAWPGRDTQPNAWSLYSQSILHRESSPQQLDLHLVTVIMPQLAASDTSDGSSSEDAHTAGSEIEQMLITDDWTMKEYILGKRYFEVILMGHLLKSATCDESLPEFDVRPPQSLRDERRLTSIVALLTGYKRVSVRFSLTLCP